MDTRPMTPYRCVVVLWGGELGRPLFSQESEENIGNNDNSTIILCHVFVENIYFVQTDNWAELSGRLVFTPRNPFYPTIPYPLPNRSLRTTSLARVFAWRLSSFRSEFCAAWR